MSDQVSRQEILDFTTTRSGMAVAECIAGLDCTVFSEGKELPVWASVSVAERLPVYALHDGAVLKSDAHFDYWVLTWDGMRIFEPLKGPMTTAEFRAYLRGAR